MFVLPGCLPNGVTCLSSFVPRCWRSSSQRPPGVAINRYVFTVRNGKAYNFECIYREDRAFFDAEDKLRQVVSERNHMLREKRLAAIEQAFGTENFGWQTLNVSLSARRAIDGVSNLADAGKLDVQSVERIERDYQAAFDKADAFAKAHPDVKTRLGNSPKWFSLSSDFNSFLAELKEMRRLLASNPDQQAVQARLSKLQVSYNGLIRTYNMTPDV